MQETSRLVEYGVPIDANIMIEPPDTPELELEPGRKSGFDRSVTVRLIWGWAFAFNKCGAGGWG